MKRFLTNLLILSVLLSSLLLTGCHGTMDPDRGAQNGLEDEIFQPPERFSTDIVAPEGEVRLMMYSNSSQSVESAVAAPVSSRSIIQFVSVEAVISSAVSI